MRKSYFTSRRFNPKETYLHINSPVLCSEKSQNRTHSIRRAPHTERKIEMENVKVAATFADGFVNDKKSELNKAHEKEEAEDEALHAVETPKKIY